MGTPFYCKRCGAENPSVFKVCVKCNAPLYQSIYATNNTRASLGLGISLVVAGAGVAFFMLGGSKLLGEWYGSNFCLVDANGDGVADLAGFSSAKVASNDFVIVNGKTGDNIASGQTFTDGDQLYCAGPKTVLIASPDFTLTALGVDAKVSWQKRLSDKVSRITYQEPCTSVETIDQEQVWLSPLDGSPCDGAAPASPARDPWDEPKEATANLGDTLFTLSAKAKGTPVLSVRATAGERLLWERELPAQKLSRAKPNLMLAAFEGVLFVGGLDIETGSHFVYSGLNPQSGEVLYQIKTASGMSGNLFDWHHDTNLVFVQWGWGMHAYNPQTGERIWHIGGR